MQQESIGCAGGAQHLAEDGAPIESAFEQGWDWGAVSVGVLGEVEGVVSGGQGGPVTRVAVGIRDPFFRDGSAVRVRTGFQLHKLRRCPTADLASYLLRRRPETRKI